jgi:small subunit ribosomal protein S15
MVTKENKAAIMSKFAQSAHDTGSCEVQVALLSARIKQISAHLKDFPKDNHSRRGLLGLVGQRKTFLKYLKRTNVAGHDALVASLKQDGYL